MALTCRLALESKMSSDLVEFERPRAKGRATR